MLVINKFRYIDPMKRMGICDIIANTNKEGVTIFIITERDDNPGASITNSAENIVSLLCNLFQIKQDTIFIEHYYHTISETDNSYDKITIVNGYAKWTRLTSNELKEIIGDGCYNELPDQWKKNII